MKKIIVLGILVLFLFSSLVAAAQFRGRTTSIYSSIAKDSVDDEVIKTIRENPKRFTLFNPGKGAVKTNILTDQQVRSLLMYKTNEQTLKSVISFIKEKDRFSSKIKREVVGKIYRSRGYVRQKRGFGIYQIEDALLTDTQIDRILSKCSIDGKGIFYDTVKKQNKKFEDFTREQLKHIIKIGPRQHKCIIQAAK